MGFKKKLELLFERGLWDSRIMVILPVIFSLVGALVLFTMGSIDILNSSLNMIMHSSSSHNSYEEFVISVIRAIDLYLVGVILLIFSFGLYELFISKIDYFDDSEASETLKTHSLEQLKNRIGKTIIMVLAVYLLKVLMYLKYESPTDILLLSLSILALSIALYTSHKHE